MDGYVLVEICGRQSQLAVLSEAHRLANDEFVIACEQPIDSRPTGDGEASVRFSISGATVEQYQRLTNGLRSHRFRVKEAMLVPDDWEGE